MSMNKANKTGKIRFGISKKLLLTVILLTVLMLLSLVSAFAEEQITLQLWSIATESDSSHQAYVDAIKDRGAELGIPVLDLFEKLGIDPNNDDEKARYTVDGLHFNDDGQVIMARVLGEFLTSL